MNVSEKGLEGVWGTRQRRERRSGVERGEHWDAIAFLTLMYASKLLGHSDL